MRVLLINPPCLNEISADDPTFLGKERGFNPPLGLLYLAGYLKKKGRHQVFGLDAQVESLGYNDEFKQRIKEINPDAVGITAMTFTLIDVLKTIDLIKEVEEKLNKKIIIILGGPHAHLFPQETIKLKNVDFLIKGEGEVSFFYLLEALEGRGQLKDIKGLVYQKEGEIIVKIENLPELETKKSQAEKQASPWEEWRKLIF